MARRSLVAGVDGGGTRTVCLVADAEGHVLSRQEGGAANPNVVGYEAAASHIGGVVTDACAEVHAAPHDLQILFLGLAGAGRDSDRRRIRQAVNALLVPPRKPPLNIRVETDARIALEGAFAGGTGVVIIAGTGSVVLGKSPRGEIASAGGWGRIFGDEGGGFYIGREALAAVALAYDGRGEAGTLRDTLAGRFGWTTRDHIIAAVYQEHFEISSLAPLVMEAAANNDPVCQRLLQRAAGLLVEQAGAVVRTMGVLRKIPLALSGGLVAPGTVYANLLHMKILRTLPQVDVRPSLHEPAQGAVLMALDALKGL
ncbi:MAG: BadF/BadG/BcrA/BcrD ATPase family protein [Bacteroidota bacterium]